MRVAITTLAMVGALAATMSTVGCAQRGGAGGGGGIGAADAGWRPPGGNGPGPGITSGAAGTVGAMGPDLTGGNVRDKDAGGGSATRGLTGHGTSGR